MSSSIKASFAALTLVAMTAFANDVGAHDSNAAASLRSERSETYGPNRQLLRSGAWTLGLSYTPALVVAIKSERRGDDYLYYPVVGPWLDLAHRGECATCSHETLNQGLLVADGVFQGIGALQIVGSFLLPERQSVRVTSRASAAKTSNESSRSGISLRLRPVRLSNGYGLQATAKF